MVTKLSAYEFMAKIASTDPAHLALATDNTGDITIDGERYSCAPIEEDQSKTFHQEHADVLSKAVEVIGRAHALAKKEKV